MDPIRLLSKEQSDLDPYCLQYRIPKNISGRGKVLNTISGHAPSSFLSPSSGVISLFCVNENSVNIDQPVSSD